jgi:hypothetical protein
MAMRQGTARVARRAVQQQNVTRGMATGKDLKFGVEGRAAMLAGVEKLADAVQVIHTVPALCGLVCRHMWRGRDAVLFSVCSSSGALTRR